MQFTFERKFNGKIIRKILCDDNFWYVLSDVFKAIGKDANDREKPIWNKKWPQYCRRFMIKDRYKKNENVNALCAQTDGILGCFGMERTEPMRKMSRWLIKECGRDMEWAEMMEHARSVAACEDEEERMWLEEEWERDLDRKQDKWLNSLAPEELNDLHESESEIKSDVQNSPSSK
ncbi:hypothetical protein KJ652_07420 [Patescibacteria group bacterium]|nr:hypothetical protein [Patescibacteria group bacterium]MBU1124375.1 hypothetical protein [Patescibacteria group bacterium]MBU1910942.1 hypothetical protein [Patescibacteria group bacterium]